MLVFKKKKLVDFKDAITKHSPAYGISPTILKDSIFYYAEGNDKDIRNLTDINNIWGKSKLIATSPSITVGCSFSPDNDRINPHFDKTYVNAFPSCCVRDTFQQIMRVRHTKTNTLIFSLPNDATMNIIRNSNNLIFKLFNEYENHYNHKVDMYITLCNSIIEHKIKKKEKCDDIIRIKETFENNNVNIPPALRKILFFNLYETTISSCYYKEMFFKFLDRCNYCFLKLS